MNIFNGFLVTGEPQLLNNILYNGVECDPWPLERNILEKTLTADLMDRIDEQIDDLLIKDNIALLDLESVKMYAKACELNKQRYCIKFVEVIRNDSVTADLLSSNSSFNSITFLGYDIGDCAYDYFSAVLSDIIARPLLFGIEMTDKLNSNGLFESFEDAKSFLTLRRSASKNDTGSNFEICNMDIMKIYAVAF